MHKLVDYVCRELEELEQKVGNEHKLSMAEVEYADKLAHLKKNILRAEEMEGMSEAMDGSYRMSREGSYRGSEGNSMRNSMRYSERGEGGSYRTRDSRGRYSRTTGKEAMDEMVDCIYSVMDDFPEELKRDAQKLVQKVERM